MQVLDYSAGFPGARAIRDAGYAGAVRYIGFPDRPKCTTRAELDDFTAHGIGMALVYEDHADDWRAGFNGGAAAARRARGHADAIGFPRERPIYMAVDRDVVTEDEFKAAMAYLRGAASVLGAEWVGVYGEHDVVARAASEGAARWFWQCRAWSGVPTPRLFAGRHLYQHVGYVYPGGIQCDFNDVLVADWGSHLAEEDMTPDQDDKLTQLHRVAGSAYEALPDGTELDLGSRMKDLHQTFVEGFKINSKGTGRTVVDIETKVESVEADVKEVKEAIGRLETSGVPVNLVISLEDKAEIAQLVLNGLRERLVD